MPSTSYPSTACHEQCQARSLAQIVTFTRRSRMNLQEFLTRFGEPLAQRVTESFTILHDPVRDLAARPAMDDTLAALKRPCYPAQAEAAKALARGFFEQNERALILSGEMGTGKTQVSLALLAIAPTPQRMLVMCPPHLVGKWEREAKAVLPAVRVMSLGGKNCLKVLTHLAARHRSGALGPPEVPEVWILGRERAKLHHSWRPAYATRLMSRAEDIWTGTGSTRQVNRWRDPACVRCGGLLLDKVGMPLPVDDLSKRRTFCPHCKEPAFVADREGPRRYAPAEFIKRYLPFVFDLLVADEVHELKGEDTGQGNAFGALASAAKKSLSMTGSLLGGYADQLFFILYRSDPTVMVQEGFPYKGVQAWMEKFGILERTTKVRPNDEGSDHRTVRGKSRSTSIRRKPGISPLILGKHLLPRTVFLRLADVAEALPPYEERVVSLTMPPSLESAYRGLEADLKQCVQQALSQGSQHLLSIYLQSLLCYPDQAGFREERVVDPRNGKQIAYAPVVDEILPKEIELLRLCQKEVREKGRRVLVYVTFTDTRDLTPRIASLLSDTGLRVRVLKPTVKPEQRETWIAERVKEGIDVLICNPELVKTGLDLIAFPTFAWVCPGYSIYTLRQATRRAWRIGQTQPCEVVYFTYADTMQSKALALIATKLEASLMIEGELSDNGLSALADTSDSLIIELARALVNHVGAAESAEAIWARLRTKSLEQMLTLTTARPAPAIRALAPAGNQADNHVLLMDPAAIEVPSGEIQEILARQESAEAILRERPDLRQLSLI
jgi:SNF2 family DNA or RNA helicase